MASYYLKGYTTPDGVNSRADVREWQNKLGVKADGIWARIRRPHTNDTQTQTQ